MNKMFDDIIGHFKYGDLEKKLRHGKMGLRSRKAIATEYIFDILSPGPVPHDAVKQNQIKYHDLDSDDRIFYYGFDDINECILLYKNLCEKFEFAFLAEEEAALRKEYRNTHSLLFFIIERPIFQG